MNTYSKAKFEKPPKVDVRRNTRRRLAVGAAITANFFSLAGGVVGTNEAAAGESSSKPGAKPEKLADKPSATAIYGYGKDAVRVPLAFKRDKKGVLRAHDVQRDESGTRVEQHFSWSDKSHTARYWIKVNSKQPIIDTAFVELNADCKVGDRWQALYQPNLLTSSFSYKPTDYMFERTSAVLSSEQQAVAAGADVVRWTPFNTFGRMSIRLPNQYPLTPTPNQPTH